MNRFVPEFGMTHREAQRLMTNLGTLACLVANKRNRWGFLVYSKRVQVEAHHEWDLAITRALMYRGIK